MPDMSVWGEGVWGLLELGGGAEYLDVVKISILSQCQEPIEN